MQNIQTGFILNKKIRHLNKESKQIEMYDSIQLIKRLVDMLEGEVKVRKEGNYSTTFTITVQNKNKALLKSAIHPKSVQPSYEGFVNKVVHVVELHLNDECFGILQLCKEIGLSRSQLHNKIKSQTGLSTSIFIRSIRLERAKELLWTTELNISEIAFEVGFKDPSYFSRLFIDKYSVSPSRFRNLNF